MPACSASPPNVFFHVSFAVLPLKIQVSYETLMPIYIKHVFENGIS